MLSGRRCCRLCFACVRRGLALIGRGCFVVGRLRLEGSAAELVLGERRALGNGRRQRRGSDRGVSVAASHGVAEAEEDAADEDDTEKNAEQRTDTESQIGIASGFFLTVFVEKRLHRCSSGFGVGGGVATPGPVMPPATVLLNNEISSMGRGKTIVVFFSVPMSVRV